MIKMEKCKFPGVHVMSTGAVDYVPVCDGKEKGKQKRKHFYLRVDLCFNLHVGSWAVDGDQRNKIAQKEDWNGLPLKGHWTPPHTQFMFTQWTRDTCDIWCYFHCPWHAAPLKYNYLLDQHGPKQTWLFHLACFLLCISNYYFFNFTVMTGKVTVV